MPQQHLDPLSRVGNVPVEDDVQRHLAGLRIGERRVATMFHDGLKVLADG